MRRFFGLSIIMLLLLSCNNTNVTSTSVVIQIPTPVLVPTRTPLQPATATAIRPTAPPATPEPPRLLVERAPDEIRTRFADAAPSGWIVTRSITTTRFGIHSWRNQTTIGATNFDGTPLHWTQDGALLLMTSPTLTNTLLGLEPTSGITTTVLTTTLGTISDAYWLREAIIYTVQTTNTQLVSYRGTEQVLATIPNRQLAPAGLILSPDQQTFAIIVTDPVSASMELYSYQRETQQLVMLDRSLRGTASPRAVWAADGRLAYYIGDDFRIYNPQEQQIQTTNLGAEPLAWRGDSVLVRSLDNGALVSWSPTLVQPFSSGTGAILVSDVIVLDQRTLALLIDGEVWLANL